MSLEMRDIPKNTVVYIDAKKVFFAVQRCHARSDNESAWN